MRVRKKPVEVEAVQLKVENEAELKKWAGDKIEIRMGYYDCQAMIKTLEGTMHAADGDWIIKGVNGEFYSCKDDIFRKTYDIIDSNESNVISWC